MADTSLFICAICDRPEAQQVTRMLYHPAYVAWQVIQLRPGHPEVYRNNKGHRVALADREGHRRTGGSLWVGPWSLRRLRGRRPPRLRAWSAHLGWIRAHRTTFNALMRSLKLPTVADELSRLRTAEKGQMTPTERARKAAATRYGRAEPW